ncbi:beta-barrel assembly machinery complex, BamA/YaeT protein [Campylobacter iguaniorum]|uniref:outer membrane protein assembly factor BamA n=1 Tax=Campylobacter iguaniorum TaxID=1244531 RepID=UPI0007C8B83F|nr:outer membrane protein assembly factor BamA [Campylobacter iguaniorum]ANE35405.1 beta-barrel assembly machinery complex, BamA/YaeT protein [Campylobacter iguaniorum]
MKKTLFLVGLSLPLALSAATIKSIAYKGLIHLSSDSATDISGLRVGDELNAQNSNQAIVNLYKQGYFKDIFIEENDGNVVINLTEKPSIARLDIEGVVTNDKKAIDTILGIKQGQMYDQPGIKKAKERIRQYYETKGYFDTVTDVTTEPMHGNPNALHVTMTVNRGEKITIEKVNLVGAEVLDYSDIEPAVANKEYEFMGWMWGRNDGGVKIFDLPNDPNKIRDEYLKKGYLDASVSNPYLNTYFDNYTADLTYYVSEGNPYNVNSISIEAPSELELDNEKIIYSLKLTKGDRLNSEWLKQDIEKIENLVADKGYAYVRVYPQTNKNEADKTVDIIYQVVPNDKVYIRNVVISGNDRTADRVIRRELYLTEGNLYNRTDLVDSKNALKRSGYFEDASIKENRINKDQVDLEVVVKETSTGSITGGIGYGTSDGLLLSAGVSDTNVFGTGYKGSVSVDKSDDTLSGTISLTNPRVNDSEYSLGGSIYANDYEWDDYEEKNYGFSVTGGRKFGRYTNVFLTYQLEQSKISGLDEFYTKAGYQNGKNLKSSIIPGITFNNTDDYYVPRSGIIAGTSFEYAGAGGDMEFVKNKSNFNYYLGLDDYINYDLILRYKANFGYIWNSDDDKLPINEKLFLGGLRSIRGFDSRSVTPKKDITIAAKGSKVIDTGGKIAFNNSVELSIPVIDRLKMRAMVFYDYGMIGEDNLNEIKRSSVGAGIEWVTPIGPLQLIYAQALDDKPGDDTSSFEFSIGRRF